MADVKNFYVSYIYDTHDEMEWWTIFLCKAHYEISKMTKKLKRRYSTRKHATTGSSEWARLNVVDRSSAEFNKNFESLEYAEYLHYW